MNATPLFKEKRWLRNPKSDEIGVAELKVWEVPPSEDYPSGRKFSLFLVVDGAVVVGIDNHKPKGPHLHFGDREFPYLYRNEEALLADFWDFVRKAGFEP